ncbi:MULTISPECIES: PLD nuclease N-terminal domain-containing protein [Ornithinibacillus]|uniref:PLDc_N domain-containing protein n=2 Tax=Ornithinibacillus TaxID=484508 RepID=A0A923RGP3_9BACI|nr:MULTISPECIES: PLD nuclease N-terminal domain-containing protein [Ornithinibacillus]MBC5636139.1 PLDc_N domain-containing protein [Ornithinibacillus hominis]MBS3680979.1 PLDc_N domain-containing protein [Ornithinibacillus massiliensis]
MGDINWAILAPFFIIQLILLIVAIVDLVKVRETNGPKWLWVLIIVFVSMVGPIIYFIFGRRQR